MRSLLVLILTSVFIVSFIPAFAQEEETMQQEMAATEVISGSIVSVDIEKAAIVVKQLKDEANSINQDVSIAVLPDTKISKGDTVLALPDIKAEDKVSVECSKDTEGNLKATSISIE